MSILKLTYLVLQANNSMLQFKLAIYILATLNNQCVVKLVAHVIIYLSFS